MSQMRHKFVNLRKEKKGYFGFSDVFPSFRSFRPLPCHLSVHTHSVAYGFFFLLLKVFTETLHSSLFLPVFTVVSFLDFHSPISSLLWTGIEDIGRSFQNVVGHFGLPFFFFFFN